VSLSSLLVVLTLTTPPAVADTARLTELRLVVDSSMWSDLKASAFLPEAFGPGFLAGPAEVRMCGRLSCLVMVPEDSAAGDVVGDLLIGVQSVRGSALASRLADAVLTRARVAIVEPPEQPGPTTGEAPMMYYLETATVAIEEAAIGQVGDLLRSAGAVVVQEGEGLVIQFDNQVLRLVPGWGGPGPERLRYYLRRENPGNPTYKFGPRSRLRFGPNRSATWTF
jgi:hypothetical protein